MAEMRAALIVYFSLHPFPAYEPFETVLEIRVIDDAARSLAHNGVRPPPVELEMGPLPFSVIDFRRQFIVLRCQAVITSRGFMRSQQRKAPFGRLSGLPQ